jgi:hypothetical protein
MHLKRLLAIAASLGLASAQVVSECNPTKGDDCEPNPALGTQKFFNFNSTPNGLLWESYAGDVTYDPETGAKFTIAERGVSPTIRTKFYFFWGRTEVIMKAAPGKGIVSSMMWLSDDLDEVDWEFLGTNDTHALSNFFGKGNQDWHNGDEHPMSGIHTDYHNYTCHWTKEKLEWWIDGNLVRTLTYDEASGGKYYPQTPMRLSLGIWAGGDPELPEGTREWAGGDTDFGAGPYDMYVKSVDITDFSTGKEYLWTDDTGSYSSIKVVEGNSTAFEEINKPPPEPEKTLSEKWNEMPSTTRIGIIAGAGGAGALLLGALLWFCIRQRKRGREEARLAAQASHNDRMEEDRFREQGINPDGFVEHGQEYNAREMSQTDNISGGATYGNEPKNVSSWNATPVPPIPASMNRPQSSGAGSQRSFGSGYGNNPFGDPSPAMSGAASYRDDARSPVHHNGYGAVPPTSPFEEQHFSSQHSGYGVAPPSPYEPRAQSPMLRSQSPAMRAQSPGTPPQGGLPPAPSAYARMNSPSGGSSYHSPRNSPAPQGSSFHSPRNSPGPQGSSFHSPRNSPGPQGSGYGRPPPQQGRDYWNQGY